MPQDQRARLNWLDRVVLVAAVLVLVAAGFVMWRVSALDEELRVNRAISCRGQLVLTNSTVPACSGGVDLANRQ